LGIRRLEEPIRDVVSEGRHELLLEIRDCVGHFHKHSPLITSKRNSPLEGLWHVIGQTDYIIRELLIKSAD
jgi:hypothetical protein